MSDDDTSPCDDDAERAVLGALLLSPDATPAVTAILAPDDFHRHAHQTIYATLCDLYARGDPSDTVAAAAELGRRGNLVRVGGAPYLHTLIATVPTAGNAAYYADLVAAVAQRRRLDEAAVRVRQLVRENVDDVGERARAAIDEAVGRGQRDTADGLWLGDLLTERVDEYDQPVAVGAQSGWTDLDDVLNGGRGLLAGQLVVVAARPGLGKSLILLEWIRRLAASGYPALLASLEMPHREVGDRILASEGRVGLDRLTGHRLDDHDRQQVRLAAARLQDLPLRVEDTPHMSLARLRAQVREMHRSADGIGVVGVDYLQLMTPADSRVPRHEQVGALSRGYKIMAKEFDIPVIALAQLNRASEQRADKRPAMSDLRESGSVEADADIVLLLLRPEDCPGELHVIVAKNRGGPSGMTVRLQWSPAIGRVQNLDYAYTH